ncbi:MAG: hypothetical protein KatS3mg102_2129 [Planctomycetota bacterium]|nr:MAG: hypothetical protein KatS3mg102_2129 [Planctomycetota bacterium]
MLVAALALGWVWGGGCGIPQHDALDLPGAARPELEGGERLSLAAKASYFERVLEARFIAPEGWVTYRQPATATAHTYRSTADCTIWTGCLLGAEAFRWAVTRQPRARERALLHLEGLHALGQVSGERGVWARAMWPAGLPHIRRLPEHRPGQGRYAGYEYRGDVSKDQISGVVFGLACAWKLLAAEEPRARALVREDATALAAHLLEHGLVLHWEGRPTTHGKLKGRIYGAPIGLHALIVLAAFKLAALSSGEERFRLAYRELLEQGYPELTYWTKFQLLGLTNHNNDNMQMLAAAALLLLEEDERVRAPVRAGLERTWRYVRREGNSWFTYVCQAAARERDAWALEQARRSLERFPLELRNLPFDLREDPRLAAVPRRGWPLHHGVPTVWWALPVSYRQPTSFIWRSCPYELVAGGDGSVVNAPVDYVLAYWAGRYWGLLPAEP